MTTKKPPTCLPECHHEACGGPIFLIHAPDCPNWKPYFAGNQLPNAPKPVQEPFVQTFYCLSNCGNVVDGPFPALCDECKPKEPMTKKPPTECLPHGQGRIGCWQDQLVGGEWVTQHAPDCKNAPKPAQEIEPDGCIHGCRYYDHPTADYSGVSTHIEHAGGCPKGPTAEPGERADDGLCDHIVESSAGGFIHEAYAHKHGQCPHDAPEDTLGPPNWAEQATWCPALEHTSNCPSWCAGAPKPAQARCCGGIEYLNADGSMACLDCGKILWKPKEPSAEPSAEPSVAAGEIDFVAADEWAKTRKDALITPFSNLARAYLAVCAERDELKAKAAKLRQERDAALEQQFCEFCGRLESPREKGGA